MSWWGDLETKLSQGDILEGIPLGYTVHPRVSLVKWSGKHGVSNWVPDENKHDHFLSKGKIALCVVLTHSCDLDKEESSGRVLIAPVAPIDRVPLANRDDILKQKRFSSLPLPDVPGLGTHYADLRAMLAVFRTHCDGGTRRASMTDLGRERLQAQLIGFFARRDMAFVRGG